MSFSINMIAFIEIRLLNAIFVEVIAHFRRTNKQTIILLQAFWTKITILLNTLHIQYSSRYFLYLRFYFHPEGLELFSRIKLFFRIKTSELDHKCYSLCVRVDNWIVISQIISWRATKINSLKLNYAFLISNTRNLIS